ncbi:MAG: ribonuclease HII [Actinomycetota bacterium]|nr:ribonuclease HII [Actinomycetota bacterium]
MAYKATYRTRTYGSKGGRTKRTKPVPGLNHELGLLSEGAEVIGGIDEVGVGAWAGPVAVSCVVLDPARRIYKLRDSKLLDPPRREWLAERVRSRCISWSVGLSWPDEIDDVGLSEAMRRAGARAIEGLAVTPDAFLLDGRWNFIGGAARTVVRGDCESVSIAAASVVAKVARDALMCELSQLYPEYLFGSNKGYPSPRHKWALAAFGPSPIHRRLYAPIQRLVDEGAPGRLLTTGSV